ncbi:MAG: hypothetical protein JWM53_5184 [bacterium]|nr:hypothetical protein [bacterium]
MAEQRLPLANDIDGNPIDVPENAVAWRVRRRLGRGRPQSVFDPATGAQLEILLEATVDDLRPFGPGGYRLDAIDDDGNVIEGVVAYTEVHDIGEVRRRNAAAAPDDHFGRLIAALEHMADTNCRALEALANAFGPVSPRYEGDDGPPVEADAPASSDDLVRNVASVVQTVATAFGKKGGEGGGAPAAAGAA